MLTPTVQTQIALVVVRALALLANVNVEELKLLNLRISAVTLAVLVVRLAPALLGSAHVAEVQRARAARARTPRAAMPSVPVVHPVRALTGSVSVAEVPRARAPPAAMPSVPVVHPVRALAGSASVEILRSTNVHATIVRSGHTPVYVYIEEYI